MWKRILLVSLFLVLGALGTAALLLRFGADAPAGADPGAGETHQAAQVQPAPDPRDVAVQDALQSLTLEQRVGQLFFARCPDGKEAVQAAEYGPGGYILFARDFENRTADSLREMLAECQKFSSVPMLFGVDEEGGTVCRVSRYKQYRETGFLSPQKLYRKGGMDAVTTDAEEKAALLHGLGITVNFAPVCDVSTDSTDYIYSRAFGRDAAQTSTYVSAVVRATQAGGVGCVLKHFPGYGSNADTHTGIAVDKRSLATFEQSDFLPFTAGIEAGAGAVLVSHNIVECMDAERPASLSPAVHRFLREQLGFDGVSLTDDLAMDAIVQDTNGASAAVLALQAGNDMLLSSDIASQYPTVLAAVRDGTLSETQIDSACACVLGWKYDLGLLG